MPIGAFLLIVWLAAVLASAATDEKSRGTLRSFFRITAALVVVLLCWPCWWLRQPRAAAWLYDTAVRIRGEKKK